MTQCFHSPVQNFLNQSSVNLYLIFHLTALEMYFSLLIHEENTKENR